MASDPISLASAGPLVAKLASALAQPAKGMAAKAKEKLEVRFQKGFAHYIAEQSTRFSRVKTIISSNTPIPLLDIYVNLHLASAARTVRDDEFLTQIAKHKSVLFTATAGAGKSMLMRYLFLRFLEEQTERLPLFIELRDLNQHPAISIREFVRAKLSDYIADFSTDQLHYALDTGRVILFLDGFDEIDHDKRKTREREINDLAARFQNLWIFGSSRPSEDFASWETFHVYRVKPFTKKQVEQLIAKIPYDDEIKKLFAEKMSKGLYESHQEFLTNPLL